MGLFKTANKIRTLANKVDVDFTDPIDAVNKIRKPLTLKRAKNRINAALSSVLYNHEINAAKTLRAHRSGKRIDEKNKLLDQIKRVDPNDIMSRFETLADKRKRFAEHLPFDLKDKAERDRLKKLIDSQKSLSDRLNFDWTDQELSSFIPKKKKNRGIKRAATLTGVSVGGLGSYIGVDKYQESKKTRLEKLKDKIKDIMTKD